jgi:hypothetical protein
VLACLPACLRACASLLVGPCCLRVRCALAPPLSSLSPSRMDARFQVTRYVVAEGHQEPFDGAPMAEFQCDAASLMVTQHRSTTLMHPKLCSLLICVIADHAVISHGEAWGFNGNISGNRDGAALTI